MNAKTLGLRILVLIFACSLGSVCFFVVSSLADDHREHNRHFEREDQHRLPFTENDCKGNETGGQIAAWLLVLANFTVAISILTRWINRFASLGSGFKKTLTNLNRFQKKHLMRFHYYLNPAIAGIALWHWLTSCCRSTALPEWGLLLMVMVITLGLFLKYKIGPKPFQKTVYQIHTQPFIFIAIIMLLTIGHIIVD